MTEQKKKKTNKIIYFLAFVIPPLIMGTAFFSLGIYPGSKNLVVTYDLRALFMSLYGYISNSGPGFDSFLYSMSGCLGGGFYGTTVLCLSPFDFVFSFIPVRYIPDAIYFLILFKVGLCGLSFFLFEMRSRKFELSECAALIFSCCYALMSYNFMYYLAPMWYDVIILLPLLALLLETVCEGKKSLYFILLMSFCIIDDYYIAFMAAVTLALYFIFILSEMELSLHESIKRFCSFAVHGILSGGIAALVLVPVVMDFTRGKLSETAEIIPGSFIKNSLIDVLNSFKPLSYSGLGFNASPNIFCGSVCLFLALCFFVLGKKHIRSRIIAGAIVVFYFLSFMIGPLDNMWHGFRQPNNFSVRYSFGFCFILICLAIRGFTRLKGFKNKISDRMAVVLNTIVFIYVLLELFVNGSYILAKIGTECGYGLRKEYYKYCDVADELIPYEELNDVERFGRLMTNYKYSSYDGALFGYDGLSRFSSSYNNRLSDFIRFLGIGSIYQTTTEFGLTPPVFGLFGGRYYVSYWIDQSDYYDTVKRYETYTLYENPYPISLAFEKNKFIVSEKEFSDDPFANINTLYSELVGDESYFEHPVFIKQDILNIRQSDIELPEGIRASSYYKFTTAESGHYFFFGEYIVDEYIGSNESTTHRECYIDGVDVGSYGNRKYSLCKDLGYLEKGEEHILRVDSSNEEIGEVFLYCYNSGAYSDIAASINGFELKNIGRKGITVAGSVDEESEILVTLPYEAGYRVIVDGKKTEYGSYREMFITIPVSEGKHEIFISYFPPGLAIGCIITLIFVFFAFIYQYFGIIIQRLSLFTKKNR